MIRIQIYCHACKQIVDCTVAARRGRAIAATFEDLHTLDACMEEPDGQDQEGPGAGEADEGADAAAIKVGEAPQGRPN